MAEEIKLEFKQEVPGLVFDTNTAVVETAKETAVANDVTYMEDVNLTEEEKKTVDEFANQIDIADTGAVMVYGAGAQKKVSDFSDTALEGVRNKDLGEVGNTISMLVAELKGFGVDAEEKKGLGRLFKKTENKVAVLKSRYDKTEKNVDNIVAVLEDHQNRLTTDIVMLDKMYDVNLAYFKELSMYILAGKQKLEQERSVTLPELQKKAQESGLAEDAQRANDYASACDRFEKKLYDLELTRTISIQMAPQIRTVQGNDSLMTEKIQSVINNTIPLWKNQMVLALNLEHSKEAMEAEKAVTDVTNELLKKNAEMLKQGSIQIATESERGIVDIETVQLANDRLIETLTEVIRIQEDGRNKRKDAENRLGQMEAELKQKLLELKTQSEAQDG